MPKAKSPTESPRKVIKPFLIEIPLYAVMVIGYFFLVLHFMGSWLHSLFDANKPVYALVSLLLIVAQGVLLEFFSTRLLAFVRTKTDRP